MNTGTAPSPGEPHRAVLLVLLAAEGVTILRVHQLLSPHVFIGVVLIPPVLLKVASTTRRFARYYAGAPEGLQVTSKPSGGSASAPSGTPPRHTHDPAGGDSMTR